MLGNLYGISITNITLYDFLMTETDKEPEKHFYIDFPAFIFSQIHTNSYIHTLWCNGFIQFIGAPKVYRKYVSVVYCVYTLHTLSIPPYTLYKLSSFLHIFIYIIYIHKKVD